jgi:hypothetical protein
MTPIPLAGTSPTIIAAIIAAAASLIVALLSAVFTKRNSARVKQLEDERAESDAARSYRYEARKRLYAVCEPVLFQATEQAEYARSRIRSLARSASEDHLRLDGSGWLAATHKYYFTSIVYGLMAPVTSFTLLQRQLTTIDLGLDRRVRERYELLKLIFLSFCQDWELALCGDGRLESYDRNKTDPGEPDRDRLLRESPELHAPQGFYRATVYVIAEALTIAPVDGSPGSESMGARCMTFGEFDRAWTVAPGSGGVPMPAGVGDSGGAPGQSPLAPIREAIVELFCGFHPMRRPVLWRVLVYQYLLYGTLLRGDLRLQPVTDVDKRSLDWRQPGDRRDELETIGLVEAFASKQLSDLRERLLV